MGRLLDVRGLSVEFTLGGSVVPAVNGVDLRVDENETVVIAGESGSGKTVTALALTRLLPPNARISAGQAVFLGDDLLSMGEKELQHIRGRRIAYIFQEPASFLNPVLSIGEQLAEGVRLQQRLSRKQADAVSVELLRQVQIHEPKRVLASYPHQLSGGMNQRVFIAMSLAAGARLVVADEPTTSLDVTVEREILELLLELREKKNFSLMFITHNLSIAKRIAQRVYVMYRGRVVEEGAVEELFRAARHEHTLQLLAAYEKIGRL
jgi:ABC-type dipeptide/oligopeptide/nickel transport system ATPase component